MDYYYYCFQGVTHKFTMHYSGFLWESDQGSEYYIQWLNPYWTFSAAMGGGQAAIYRDPILDDQPFPEGWEKGECLGECCYDEGNGPECNPMTENDCNGFGGTWTNFYQPDTGSSDYSVGPSGASPLPGNDYHYDAFFMFLGLGIPKTARISKATLTVTAGEPGGYSGNQPQKVYIDACCGPSPTGSGLSLPMTDYTRTIGAVEWDTHRL